MPEHISPPPAPRRWRRRAVQSTSVVLLGYLGVAYLALPLFWEHYTHRHPALEDIPNITHTTTGIPGDPLNVSLIGSENDVKRIMLAAHWFPADALTFKSCLEIAEATVLKRAYEDAPVSSLYYQGRKENLAFEKPVGHDPRERHHVRYWRLDKPDMSGRPVWVGAVTFDRRVGFSHTTGEITHHIAADIDAERDALFQDLRATGDLEETSVQKDFHHTLTGRNGGGDPWQTDGDLYVGVIAQPATTSSPK